MKTTMKQFVQEHGEDIGRGFFGMFGTGAGIGISFSQSIEMWLRIASLCVGLAIGIATLIQIIRNMRKP